jgi:hypothetical protein
MGEYSNFINLPMLKASISKLLEWTPDGVRQYCDILMKPFTETLTEKGFWLEEDPYRAKHLFGCKLPEYLRLDNVQQKLKDKNVFVSFREIQSGFHHMFIIMLKILISYCWP